jgi:hypothetical protein
MHHLHHFAALPFINALLSTRTSGDSSPRNGVSDALIALETAR